MPHLFRLFKPRTRKSSCDEITKHVVDCWTNFRAAQFYEGVPLYITRDGRNTTAQYGTVLMRIEVHTVYSRDEFGNKSKEDTSVYIGYNELGNESTKNAEFLMHVVPSREIVRLRETKPSKNYGYDDFDIEVPFELMNEYDFFQFETLNPVLPISREVLVKLIDVIRKDLS